MSDMIKAMRLKALPLPLAGTGLGLMLAAADYRIKLSVAVYILLTAACLQIMANLCKELGDTLRRIEDGLPEKESKRVRSAHGLSQGDINTMISVFMGLGILFALLAVNASFGTLFSMESLCLAVLGFAVIRTARNYSLGRAPYGYNGLGDPLVFLFYGVLAVMGSYFMSAHTLTWLVGLPACAVGLFCTGALNCVNMKSGSELTVARRLGPQGAKLYHTGLVVLGWAAMLAYCLMRFPDLWHYLFVLTLPGFIVHLAGVWKGNVREISLILSVFAFAMLGGLGYLVFLL